MKICVIMSPVLQILLHLLVAVSTENLTPGFETRHLSVLFRHGDRTPKLSERHPKDPHIHRSYHPEGPGGLTKAGKLRVYQLGRRIREEYGSFLGDMYLPNEVLARSTNTPRTIMSLQLVMAGVYPPCELQRWNPELNWQPFVMSFPPGRNDYLGDPCPQYFEEMKRIETSPEIRRTLEGYADLLKNLTEWTGQEMTSPKHMYRLYHTLASESLMGLELPDWTKHVFPDGLLLNGTAISYDIASYNPKLKKLNGGRALKVMIDSMQGVVHGVNSNKLNLFSAHEPNIAGLLHALGVYTPHVPAYSSAVFIELLRNGTDHYVAVKYFKGIPPEIEEKIIPGCDTPCPLKDFLSLLSDVVPSEDEMNCIIAEETSDPRFLATTSVVNLITRNVMIP